jgi:hypothetical protein
MRARRRQAVEEMQMMGKREERYEGEASVRSYISTVWTATTGMGVGAWEEGDGWRAGEGWEPEDDGLVSASDSDSHEDDEDDEEGGDEEMEDEDEEEVNDEMEVDHVEHSPQRKWDEDEDGDDGRVCRVGAVPLTPSFELVMR